MLWLLIIAGVAVLAHTTAFPFLLDVTDRAVRRELPKTDPPTIYLTFDDGPNPTATPQLMDVLKKHGVRGTLLRDRQAPHERHCARIVRRAFEEGHAVALHSATRALMFQRPARVSTTLQEAAARIEVMTGHPPCRAFRPHAGHRSITMLDGAGGAGYRVIGFGSMPRFPLRRPAEGLREAGAGRPIDHDARACREGLTRGAMRGARRAIDR